MKVKAKKLGYIHGKRYRAGDEFECTKSEFSARWMEKVETRGRKKVEEKPVEQVSPKLFEAPVEKPESDD